MTQPVLREGVPALRRPECDEPMRREHNGVRRKPHVFWYCVNARCKNGSRNGLYEGGSLETRDNATSNSAPCA